jgi:hypothetical protein
MKRWVMRERERKEVKTFVEEKTCAERRNTGRIN